MLIGLLVLKPCMAFNLLALEGRQNGFLCFWWEGCKFFCGRQFHLFGGEQNVDLRIITT